jgi:hypothetical protein
VRRVQRVGYLHGEVEKEREAERARREEVVERLTVETLHDEIPMPFVLADVVDRADTRMAQRGDRARFPLEAPQTIRIGRKRSRQDLDRDMGLRRGS